MTGQGPDAALVQVPRRRVAGRRREVADAPHRPEEAVQDVGWRSDDGLLEPGPVVSVRQAHATLVHRQEQRTEGGRRRLEVALPPALAMNATEQRDSLSLSERRVPAGAQEIAVLPVELVLPDRHSVAVRRELADEPVGRRERPLPSLRLPGADVEVEVAEPPLRDRGRIVLQADVTAVVEERDAFGIEMSRVVGLGEEALVVLDG